MLVKIKENRTVYYRSHNNCINICYISSDCKPVSIWGYFRNGKTYPDQETAYQMKEALLLKKYIESSSAIRNTSLCAQDVENLVQFPINDNMFKLDGYLTEEGQQDMVGIGKRLHHEFPELFENLKDEDVSFISTHDTDVESSTKAFAEGLGNVHFDTASEEEVKLISVSHIIISKDKRQNNKL